MRADNEREPPPISNGEDQGKRGFLERENELFRHLYLIYTILVEKSNFKMLRLLFNHCIQAEDEASRQESSQDSNTLIYRVDSLQPLTPAAKDKTT
jgi:hypothetical protein